MNEEAPEPRVERRLELRERLQSAYRSLPSERHPSFSEDAYLVDEELGLFGVFDGVGGHSAGREASAAAAGVIANEIRTSWEEVTDDDAENIRPSLANVLRAANKAVISRGHELYLKEARDKRAEWKTPQTTATIAKVYEFGDGRVRAYLAHVGDCRAYVRRVDGTLEQLTQEDDLISDPNERDAIEARFHVRLSEADIARYRELLDEVAGETAMPDAVGRYLFRTRNRIRLTLGHDYGEGRMGVQTYAVDVQPGDTILMMSDGVHDNLTDRRIRDIAATTNDADALVDRLSMEAYEYGHMAPEVHNPEAPVIRNKRDDITVMAIRVKPRT